MSTKFAALFLALAFLTGVCFAAPQKEPTKQRTLEIQHALVTHGYSVQVTGKWDDQTKAALFKIADERGWQVDHVPDARVLILLDLGGPNANPDIATLSGNHLDKMQRNK